MVFSNLVCKMPGDCIIFVRSVLNQLRKGCAFHCVGSVDSVILAGQRGDRESPRQDSDCDPVSVNTVGSPVANLYHFRHDVLMLEIVTSIGCSPSLNLIVAIFKIAGICNGANNLAARNLSNGKRVAGRGQDGLERGRGDGGSGHGSRFG